MESKNLLCGLSSGALILRLFPGEMNAPELF